jgi:hypothetical protein
MIESNPGSYDAYIQCIDQIQAWIRRTYEQGDFDDETHSKLLNIEEKLLLKKIDLLEKGVIDNVSESSSLIKKVKEITEELNDTTERIAQINERMEIAASIIGLASAIATLNYEGALDKSKELYELVS